MKKVDQPSEGSSEREREVLQFVARGLSYKEIGEELYISAKTVENHTRNILRKHLSRKSGGTSARARIGHKSRGEEAISR